MRYKIELLVESRKDGIRLLQWLAENLPTGMLKMEDDCIDLEVAECKSAELSK